MVKRFDRSTAAAAVLLVAAIGMGGGTAVAAGPTDAEVARLMKESFRARGLATLDRLDQTESQAACSKYATTPMPPEVKARLEKAAMDRIRYPADGRYLGDFRQGERIAQSGVGLQFSDDEKTVNGGNCYACHQISKAELAHGNIGPSLYNYGKLRGTGEEILKYTWGRLWNSHAFNACNQMPRYGDARILTDDQLRDVMALLLDPKSPVNQ
jgi:sulfur-oxidizing protein SoxX